MRLVEHRPIQSEVLQVPRGDGPARVAQHALELLADPFVADPPKMLRLVADRLSGVGIDGEIESGREAHRPQRPQAILAQAGRGVADGPDASRLEVRAAPDVIEDFAGEGVLEEPVDREVASSGVVLGIGEDHLVGVAPVGVDPIGPEGRHLDGVALHANQHDPEGLAHALHAVEELSDALRPRVGGHVVVGGLVPHEAIADAAAGEVGQVPGVGEPLHDPDGGPSQVEAGLAVVACARHGGIPHTRHHGPAGADQPGSR